MPRLEIDAKGRLQCPSHPHLITHNSPFPTHNGTPSGFAEPAWGVAIHTEVGYEHNVIAEFNNPKAEASAFISIGMDGHIHQYGPIGKGWKAWTQSAGNARYRGAENEDHGNVHNKLTAAQLASLGAFVEVCSRKDGFPIAATDNPNGGKGVIFHSDGGAAWGGHDCPGATRRAQRPQVLAKARAIRAGQKVTGLKLPATQVEALAHAVHVRTTKWGPSLNSALNLVRFDHHVDHHETEALQMAVGARSDGDWGPKSQRKYVIAVHRIQKALGVKETGKWGPATEKAFLEAKARHHN